MNTMTMRARFSFLMAAVATSAVVLGATVLGMQPDAGGAPVLVLERVQVHAKAVN